MGSVSTEVLRQFRRFRRRHLRVRGVDLFLEAAFVMTITAGALQLLDRLAFEAGIAAPHLSRPEMVVAVTAGALALAAVIAAALLVFRPVAPAQIAWQLDRASGGGERFLSAVEFAAAGEGGPFMEALYGDAARVALGAKPAQVLPRAPVGYRWGILLSVAVAALLLAFPPRTYDAPEADFTAAPARGPAPLEVSFRDASIGAIDRFAWDFGEGKIGYGEAAHHVYEKPGIYTARLRLKGPGGTAEKALRIEVLPADRASADFEAEPEKGRAPLEVRFRNLSKNVKRSEWDFGDGVTSADAEPVHVYERPGVYTVRLRAVNDLGVDEKVRGGYIKAASENAPLADFRAIPKEGPAPLEVSFEDMSTGKVEEWQWDFGDLRAGEARLSRERNPAHTFAAPGHYTVRLLARGPHGGDVEEKRHYIRVGDPGRGGRGGMPETGPPQIGKVPSGAGTDPGRDIGEKTKRPQTDPVNVGVKPHVSGKSLTQKTKVFGGTSGAGGGASEVPLGIIFPAYERAAEDTIRRERIPPAVRDTVRRYFLSIRPK